ncbi:MAG: hypothetical protein KJS64_06640 [Acidobacteria bacterium]|nr:hypothetical protein [Acidobacteriota bacterium]
MEFDSVTLLLYVRCDDAPAHSDDELHEIQTGHLAHLRAMGEAGYALTAGPFDDQSDEKFRGLVFFTVSPEEALRLTENDPAVKAGHLRADVMTWYHEKGSVVFPTRS